MKNKSNKRPKTHTKKGNQLGLDFKQRESAKIYKLNTRAHLYQEILGRLNK